MLLLEYFRWKLKASRRLICEINDKLPAPRNHLCEIDDKLRAPIGGDGIWDCISSIKDAISKHQQIYGMENYRTTFKGRGFHQKKITSLYPERYMVP